jgi:hypothetical protein
MQLNSNSISLSDAGKWSRISGNYRLVGLKTWPHITQDFYLEVVISDGETTLSLFTFKSIQLPVGGMIYIDATFVENGQRDHWFLTEIRMLSVLEALNSCNFTVDLFRQKECSKMTFGEQLKQLEVPALLKVKAMFGTRFSNRSKIEELFSFYELGILRKMLSWLLSIEFDSSEKRDYALCGGMLFLAFNRYLDPTYRLDSSRQRDMQFAEFVDSSIATLAKLDNTLSGHFECLMKHTIPLQVGDSILSEIEFVQAIQLAHFHVVELYEFQEERLNGAA